MKTNRKLEHLKICIEKDVEAGKTGFADIKLMHKALPELDWDDIDFKTKFFNKKLNAPIMIESITGGTGEAREINLGLAGIAQEFNIGFGVGSQRPAIEDPNLAETYQVREIAPDIFLMANLGAVQLNYGYGIEECEKAIEMIDADALVLHLNPLQEIIQPEGNKNFSNLIEKINYIADELKTPVIVKEIGSGISLDIAKNLKVSAIDVGGLGGTSWSLVESYRGDERTKKLGNTFSCWGIPTSECISDVSKLGIPIIGSGGIRTGVDAGKAIALGASCVGIALPIIRAWTGGLNKVREFLNQFILELKVSMFLTGSKNVADLRGKIQT